MLDVTSSELQSLIRCSLLPHLMQLPTFHHCSHSSLGTRTPSFFDFPPSALSFSFSSFLSSENFLPFFFFFDFDFSGPSSSAPPLLPPEFLFCSASISSTINFPVCLVRRNFSRTFFFSR